jgi:YD repeat-containing protein
VTQYVWDYENRLAQVTLPGNGGAVSFKYDPFGRRIYKSSSAGTSIFAYDARFASRTDLRDGDNLIEEVNASGTVVARYTQGQNIDEPLAMSRSGATSYYEAGGRERTEAEYAELFSKAGLRLTRVVRTGSPMCVVEAVKASGRVFSAGILL